MSWFADRRISTKLTIAFGCFIAICLAEAEVTQFGLHRLTAADSWTSHTYQVLAETRNLFQGIVRQDLAQKAFRKSHEPGLLELAIHEGQQPKATLAIIRSMIADNSSQERRLADLETLVGRWQAEIAAATSNKEDDDDLVEAIRATLETIDEEEKRLLAVRTRDSAEAFRFLVLINTIGPLAAIGAAMALNWLLRRRIATPVAALTEAMRRLASGDFSVEVPAPVWRDEIGDMGRALTVFRISLAEGERMRAERRDGESRLEAERAALLASMADRFEAIVGTVVKAIAASATRMNGSAKQLHELAEETSTSLGTASGTTREASATMQSIAADSGHLAESVGEISECMSRSADVATRAAGEADRTLATLEALSTSMGRIGAIVDLINGVAAQTNLLALNATIEAARAGESGRGFAVVAAEVKTLANQTSLATEDIRRQIEGLQANAAESLGAINAVSATVADVASDAVDMAHRFEMRRTETMSMAASTRQTAQVTDRVARDLETVNQGALTTGRAATDLFAAARELAAHSAVLRDESDRFVATVRTG